MKRLFISVLCLFVLAFTSCGENTSSPEIISVEYSVQEKALNLSDAVYTIPCSEEVTVGSYLGKDDTYYYFLGAREYVDKESTFVISRMPLTKDQAPEVFVDMDFQYGPSPSDFFTYNGCCYVFFDWTLFKISPDGECTELLTKDYLASSGGFGQYILLRYNEAGAKGLYLYDLATEKSKKIMDAPISYNEEKNTYTGTMLLSAGGLSEEGVYYVTMECHDELDTAARNAKIFYYDIQKEKHTEILTSYRGLRSISGDKNAFFVTEYEPDGALTTPFIGYILSEDHIDKFAIPCKKWSGILEMVISPEKNRYCIDAPAEFYDVNIEKKEMKLLSIPTSGRSHYEDDSAESIILTDTDSNTIYFFETSKIWE